jgi:multidrug resistance efflux pump
MSFIVENEITLVGMFSQNGFQTIKDGASVDIVFDNVPERIYHARIIAIPKGIGQGQVAVSGTLARTTALGGATVFPAEISIPDGMNRDQLLVWVGPISSRSGKKSSPLAKKRTSLDSTARFR